MARKKPAGFADDGRRRVIIEGVSPEVDHGRFPVKRVVGDRVTVEADIYTDGHDAIAAILRYRKEGSRRWREATMESLVNDRWRAAFEVAELGRYQFTVMAWVDTFASWRRDLRKRIDAGQDLSVYLLAGADLIERAAERASAKNAKRLREYAARLAEGGPIAERGDPDTPQAAANERERPAAELRTGAAFASSPAAASTSESGAVALDPELAALMDAHADRGHAIQYPRKLVVTVDPPRARFSSWYELFPRSSSPEPGRHGSFRDCEARLSYIASMGFDVLYLPPIHPIGHTNRKGKNNKPTAAQNDIGSPWAIGAESGGHKAVHPQLGTLADFRRLIREAEEHGLQVALDIAFQASPDHPYVDRHPDWFRHRPDGTIQYAENPPKKYEDSYPFDFESEDGAALWEELKGVFLFWIEQGVRIFRVDNPHTKPFPFWEWVINEIKGEHQDVIFLAEAFTRPKVMKRLAKLGFSQSYTYFAWRNSKWELTEYLTELTRSEMADYFRPNFWPNTPDILTEYLQTGGRSAFVARLVLAATLSSNFGIYGPAFELLEDRPREKGSEEYLDSEKYQLRHWDLDRADSLREFIARVNRIRRENGALQGNRGLRFHAVDNERIVAYSKTVTHEEPPATEHSARAAAGTRGGTILTIVNLDPEYTQSGWLDLPLEELGIPVDAEYEVHDLLDDTRYLWHGGRSYVELNPRIVPAHIFRIEAAKPMERDADENL